MIRTIILHTSIIILDIWHVLTYSSHFNMCFYLHLHLYLLPFMWIPYFGTLSINLFEVMNYQKLLDPLLKHHQVPVGWCKPLGCCSFRLTTITLLYFSVVWVEILTHPVNFFMAIYIRHFSTLVNVHSPVVINREIQMQMTKRSSD